MQSPPITDAEIASLARAVAGLIEQWADYRRAAEVHQITVAEAVYLETWARVVSPGDDVEAIELLAKRIPTVVAMFRAANSAPEVGHA